MLTLYSYYVVKQRLILRLVLAAIWILIVLMVSISPFVHEITVHHERCSCSYAGVAADIRPVHNKCLVRNGRVHLLRHFVEPAKDDGVRRSKSMRVDAPHLSLKNIAVTLVLHC